MVERKKIWKSQEGNRDGARGILRWGEGKKERIREKLIGFNEEDIISYRSVLSGFIVLIYTYIYIYIGIKILVFCTWVFPIILVCISNFGQ